MSSSDPYARLDATDQAALVRQRQVKPSELVEAAIRRIEQLNPTINAVVSTRFERAMEEARALDDRIAASRADNDRADNDHDMEPFLGVPFLLKELSDLKGSPSTSGSRYLASHMPDSDSEITRRYKASGLIILGKTNSPEFGLLPTTEPHLFGPTRNPWDLSRTAGGSSGGAAAAVAAGLTPIAHANDGGGSIRIPASCCGLFGLKPSRERSPGGNVLGLTVEHAVTWTVRDSAALLDAISAGEDERRSGSRSRSFTTALKEGHHRLRRLRIAFSVASPLGTPVHPDCAEGAMRAAQLCESLGHTVEEAAPHFDAVGVKDAFMTLWFAGLAAKIDGLSMRLGRPPAAGELEPLTQATYEQGRRISASELLLAMGYLNRFTLEINQFFEEYDLWLTPALAEPPPPLGTFAPIDGEDPLAVTERANAFVPVLPIANITGLPGMSVPLHQGADGLPIGVHFLGRSMDEATLLQLAAQLETARPWRERRPLISAHRM